MEVVHAMAVGQRWRARGHTNGGSGGDGAPVMGGVRDVVEEGVGGTIQLTESAGEQSAPATSDTRETYPALKKFSVKVERYSGRYRRVSRIRVFTAD